MARTPNDAAWLRRMHKILRPASWVKSPLPWSWSTQQTPVMACPRRDRGYTQTGRQSAVNPLQISDRPQRNPGSQSASLAHWLQATKEFLGTQNVPPAAAL
jgi:hypothetical protein